MSRLILSISVLVVIMSCLSLATTFHNQVAFAQQSTTLQTYENSTYAIKLQYPSSWEKEENGTRQDRQTDVVTFSPPAINSNSSLNISIDDISDEKGIALSQYANNSISDLKQSLKSFKLGTLTTNNVVSGSPSFKAIYTYADQNTNFKDMEIGAIKGDKVYILTYEAGMNEYDKYFPIIQGLINSFQITK